MMAATNIFYRLPSQRGTRIASIAGTECTLDQFCQYIIDIEGLNRQDFIIASGTKVFRPNSCSLQTISLQNNFHVDILIPLLGGKGGFGSLLRAIGAQIEKTTNRDACRDLSGRRLRDIKREDELKKLLELKAKLEEERREKKLRKLEKLKRESEKSKESASIQELVSMFQDHDYNRRRMEIGDILDAAVEKGLLNAKKRLADNTDANENEPKRTKSDADTILEDNNVDSAGERIPNNLIAATVLEPKVDGSESQKVPSNQVSQQSDRNVNRSYLWLGLEEDLEVSDSEDDSGVKLDAVPKTYCEESSADISR